MNQFMMGPRNFTGRNARPAIHRLGLRISRTCATSDRSLSEPSTGVAGTHSRMSVPIERSRICTNE